MGKWLRGQGSGNEPGIRALMDAYARGLTRDTGKRRDERIAGAKWINADEACRVLKHLKGDGNG